VTERVTICYALDPLPSGLVSGRQVHRHCMLATGHDGCHRSRDINGEPVHDWQWDGEGDERRLRVQLSLFGQELTS